MVNFLLDIGSPRTRNVLVILLFVAISWILLGYGGFLDPKKEIIGSVTFGWVLTGLLWIAYFWIRKHAI